MTSAGKSVRCAIYTRVSTDAGLDQKFNSLDAQYDASEAYIRSQAHANWTLIKRRYDDGGFSGGSTDRPALQKLLDDVRARKINVIVVYKVDRLTRSLADFAKLVELFDAHGVSFVSVTQQFNTTTSMGRLTLNVLLSFAQFEREVTAERIRDKIAASKRKGLWVGGMVPLGYALSDGKLSIHQDEAKTVRLIFERYLELGSANRLVADLKTRGLTSKIRKLSSGAIRGGVPFTQGPLFYILRNRFYIGEVTFKGEVLPGPQPPLLERSLFEAVQAKLTEQWSHRTRARQKSEALLTGLLFDDAGNRMIPTHATKNRVRYRYYISQPLQRGHSDDPVGSISRAPADQIEVLVTNAVRDRLTESGKWSQSLSEQNAVAAHIAKVEVRAKQLAVTLKATDPTPHYDHELAQRDDAGMVIVIPWTKPPMRKFRDVIRPASASTRRTRPIRAERRVGLIRAIARGRQWLDEITSGRLTIEEIAVRQKCSVRQINLTLSMAFLAPPLVKAAIEGRLPRGIGIAQLRDAPPEWSKQYVKLGLPMLQL
ncbi:recombinase [Afipia carboxidovorans OM5]|uniref:Putative recombinase n=1 Tax=Afipia carboxidovorans (strain ATCC 49405 / DSM 1227 / KCTC 32145 / OM5) TaxID=504832 RepID=B6JB16_AFIC5|nr:recombinase family protein [Afipia carboxidovorans]ACI92090.1 recombinase [Afipia carboxidovorans OM5]AEI04059.1 putative recombinase [Afipia carboxidovorans OM4]AEI07689.1 putative recombinase [Afipia carboxidovorans OM5]